MNYFTLSFKGICISLLCLYLTNSNGQVKAVQKVSSAIQGVTVFTTGAQITRTGEITVSPGNSQAIFEKLSPDIDQQSIKVSADGPITILSVDYSLDFINEQDKNDEILSLQKKQKDIQKQMNEQNAMLDVYKTEESALLKNQDAGGTASGTKAEDLKTLLDFERARLIEVKSKQLQLQTAIDTLQDELTKVTAQVSFDQSKSPQQTGKITVDISSKTEVKIKFTVTYVVKDANWFPSYDLRAGDLSNPIELDYKATITQNSGEDWQNVKLTLSNNEPSVSAQKPTLQTWFIAPYNLQYSGLNGENSNNVTDYGYSGYVSNVTGRIIDGQSGQGIPYATIYIVGSSVGTTSDLNGYFTLNSIPNKGVTLKVSYLGYNQRSIKNFPPNITISLSKSNLALSEVIISDKSMLSDDEKQQKEKNIPITVSETNKPTSIAFDIENPYTVNCDGHPLTVTVKTESIPAIYQYFSIPKMNENAYLVAEVTDWEQYNLMDGSANVYLDGTFVGSSFLDVTHASDTLQLSFGIDKGIQIKRTKQTQLIKRQFIGGSQTDTRNYVISIRNSKSQPINMLVQDQFPVSTDNDVTVDKQDYSGGKLDDQTGIITWNLVINPKAENNLSLKYAVKHPKDKPLQLE